MASLETQGIINYIKLQGIPYKVTDINTPDVHSKGSYHYQEGTGGQGLAVDFAGERPMMVAQMLAIFDAFAPVVGQLAELIHHGPGTTMAVKDGKWVSGPGFYGATTWSAHTNHVHVAVHKGTILAQDRTAQSPSPARKVAPMYDPPLQVVDALANPHGPGCWVLFPDGGVGGIAGCPWRGAEHQPAGKEYWGARRAARLEALGDGYTVVATDGGRYEYP